MAAWGFAGLETKLFCHSFFFCVCVKNCFLKKKQFIQFILFLFCIKMNNIMIMLAKTCLTKLNLRDNFLDYFWNMFIVSQILKLNLDMKKKCVFKITVLLWAAL